MRLLITVTMTAFLASMILPGSEAGMDEWFKGMFKGSGKRGRRRPSGGYRPIYIHAPPIIQHAPPRPPPLYKKPIPSYSYSAPVKGYSPPSKGFTSYGSGFSGASSSFSGSTGGFSTSYGKGFSSSGKGFSSVSKPTISSHSFSSGGFGGFGSSGGFKSIGSSLKAPAVVQTSYQAPAPKIPSFDLSIGHGVTSYGGGAGGLVHPELHGNGIGHDLKGGTRYGASIHGKKPAPHGFGPIKEDDLIVVKGGSGYNAHGFGIESGFNDIHIEGLSAPHSVAVPYADEIHASAGLQKGGRHVSLEPPPVYYAKGNKASDSFETKDVVLSDLKGKDIAGAGGLSLATEYKTIGPHDAAPHAVASHAAAPHAVTSHSAAPHAVASHSVAPHAVASHSVAPHAVVPLPMAEHGTSSQSYLETPPAPLYSLDSDEDLKLTIKETFQPSKQIPFPDEVVDELVIASGDVDASYSAPAVGISTAPKIEIHASQIGKGGPPPQAVVSYDAPLDYSDPIIEIVFEDAEPGYVAPAPVFDPSLYQPQSDDVEVYFIEVSDDEAYDSVDDLDLSKALQGVKEEFPQGLPSELSETLINSGYLDNAQIEVLDLETALGDNSLDHSVRSALAEAYGSESQNVATIVEAPTDQAVELRLKRLLEDKQSVKGDAELAKDLGRFRKGRYGGVVELNDRASDSYLPVTVDGNLIPIPEHPDLEGRKISGVLVYADKDTDGNGNESKKANVVLSTSTRRARQISETTGNKHWSSGDWKPISSEKKVTS